MTWQPSRQSNPLPHTQVEYWISGEVNQRFRPQLQGQLYISQRSWVDILCWHDVLPKVVMRVEPDEAFIKALDYELQIFNLTIERVMEKICAASELGIKGGFPRKSEGHPVIEQLNSRRFEYPERSFSRRFCGAAESERARNALDRCLPPHPPQRSAPKAQA